MLPQSELARSSAVGGAPTPKALTEPHDALGDASTVALVMGVVVVVHTWSSAPSLTAPSSTAPSSIPASAAVEASVQVTTVVVLGAASAATPASAVPAPNTVTGVAAAATDLQKKSYPATSISPVAVHVGMSSVFPMPSVVVTEVGGAGPTRSSFVAHDEPPWFWSPRTSMKNSVIGCAELAVPATGVQLVSSPTLWGN